MKVLFIRAKKRTQFNKKHIKSILKLKGKLGIFYSIQYKDLAKEIVSELKKTNKKISLFQQVLGCSILNKQKIKNIDAVLLVSSGKFHALNIAIQTDKPIYIYSGHKIEKFPENEIKKIRQKTKAKILKFLNLDKIGILVSLKPGQENLKLALKLQRKLKKLNKSSFIFLTDNIDQNELENFNIDIYVNMACSGISLDSFKIINLSEIRDYIVLTCNIKHSFYSNNYCSRYKHC